MRRLFLTGIAVSLCLAVRAQGTEEEIIARAAGATTAEELDAAVYERFADLLARPLNINAPESALAASGLFSPFQIASIGDYRSTSGDILSAMELSLLDGFSSEKVARLRPFLRFEGRLGASAKGVHGDVLGQGKIAAASTWKAKARVSVGERFGAAWSPHGSRYLQVSGGRWQLLAGDFRAKFGQGLVLWSGFSVAGVSTPAAMARTSSGILPTWSWTEGNALRGVAGSIRFGRLRASAFLNWQGALQTGANATLLLRRGQLGATFLRREKRGDQDGQLLVSMDFFHGLGRAEIFGEVALDALPRAVAAVGGLRFPAGDRLRWAMAGRYYPADFLSPLGGSLRASTKVSNEAGLSFSGEYASEKRRTLRGVTGFGNSVPVLQLLLTADACRAVDGEKRQLKLLGRADWQLTDAWAFHIQATERLRRGYNTPGSRTEFRTDLRWSNGKISSATRIYLTASEKAALLLYQEGGYKDEKTSLYLRGTLFFADSWQDRIYAYERDAPGSFSVPAFYGRGWKLSLMAGRKLRLPRGLSLRCYLKASWLSYPWTAGKAAKAELKGQLTCGF